MGMAGWSSLCESLRDEYSRQWDSLMQNPMVGGCLTNRKKDRARRVKVGWAEMMNLGKVREAGRGRALEGIVLLMSSRSVFTSSLP